MKTAKIIIEDKEYILKIGFGVMMEFEKEEHKNITKMSGSADLLTLGFISLKYNNPEIEWDYRYFCDNILDKYENLFTELITKVLELLTDNKENTEDKKK